jgi:hypothetical protein
MKTPTAIKSLGRIKSGVIKRPGGKCVDPGFAIDPVGICWQYAIGSSIKLHVIVVAVKCDGCA